MLGFWLCEKSEDLAPLSPALLWLHSAGATQQLSSLLAPKASGHGTSPCRLPGPVALHL